MNNTVIKVLNEEHGKKVIELFKSKGIDTMGYSVNIIGYYYGVKNNKFGCFSNIPNNCTVITLPEDLSIPRVVLVRNIYNNTWVKRELIADVSKFNIEAPYICKDINNSRYYIGWRYMKEIEEVQEMTLEEVCKELGREIKIVK